MSARTARNKRAALLLCLVGLLATVAATASLSAHDPDGAPFRGAMLAAVVALAFVVPGRLLLIPVVGAWLGVNYARYPLQEGHELFQSAMLLELPALLAVAVLILLGRRLLTLLERESLMLGVLPEPDGEKGIYAERHLRRAIEAELARSQRFGRSFALVLAGVEERRQRFDYREKTAWGAALTATSSLLRTTRKHVDSVFHYGEDGFALLLPEAEEKQVTGLVRRLRRQATRSKPSEGEFGGPLALCYGATFYPRCASNVDYLLKRAEIALRLAARSPDRLWLDGAAAVAAPLPQTLRRTAAMEPAPTVPGEGEAAPDLPAVPALTNGPLPSVGPVAGLALIGEPSVAPEEDAAAVTAALGDIEQVLSRLEETLEGIRSLRSKAA